jgi:hypothetical protein
VQSQRGSAFLEAEGDRVLRRKLPQQLVKLRGRLINCLGAEQHIGDAQCNTEECTVQLFEKTAKGMNYEPRCGWHAAGLRCRGGAWNTC